MIRPAPPWWETGVIYQIYPRSFRDATGDGVGDLRGIVERLDYLSGTLGVDAIWMSPFFPSPQTDGGYDISDFTGVDPVFGDLATFDDLVAQAHRRGLKVIVDYVPNHTSDQHPRFLASRGARDDPKRDWYVWADARPDGSPPNNWLSEMGGSVWAWDEPTRQYYLHSHYPEQPDLNWRHPAVQEAMFDVLRFWLERGVDGFRIDVAHLIMKDPALRDNPPTPAAPPNPFDKQHPDFARQRHVHDRRHPDLHAVYRDVRRLLDAYSGERPGLAIGEVEVMPWEDWVRHFGVELDELHLLFNFRLIEVPWRAAAIRAVVDETEAALPPGAWPNWVLGNHDRSRLASRIGVAQTRVAAMLLLSLRGTATLYYGDEIGMVDVPVPVAARRDRLDRDPARTPMRWSPGAHVGFAPPSSSAPWLPPATDDQTRNVADQLGDPRSLLNLYRRLLACRRALPALQTGSYRSLDPTPPDCFAFVREGGGQWLLVALNLSGDRQRLSLWGWPDGTVAVSTLLDREGPVGPDDLVLRGDEGVIIVVGGD